MNIHRKGCQKGRWGEAGEEKDLIYIYIIERRERDNQRKMEIELFTWERN